MTHDLLTDSRIDQQLIAQGQHAEALRLARLSLARRFGGLEQPLSLALERLDLSTLEALIVDATLTLDQVRERVCLGKNPAPSAHEANRPTRHPQRVSPLGGYRRS